MNVTRRRFLILLASITAVFLLAIIVWHREEQRRAEALYTTARQDASVVVDKMLELDGDRLAIFASDYSYWDEMVTFVKTLDPKWAQVNLVTSVDTYESAGVAVYNSDGVLVFSASDAEHPKLRILDLRPLEIRGLFSRDGLRHFFTTSPYGLLEVRGAKIVPGNDPERRSPARGYWFVSRLWNPEHLGYLGSLLSARVTLESPDAARRRTADEATLRTMVFRRPLLASDDNPLRTLCIASHYRGVSSLESSARGNLQLLILFAAAIILALYLFLARWVTHPVDLLSEAMVTGSATMVAGLEREKSEFGQLASLVHSSFDQKRRLESEMRDRVLADKTLRESEERFRAIYDTTYEAVMLLDENGFFDCNPRTLEVFGFDNRDDFTSVHPADVSPPLQPDGQDSLVAAQARIETALREGQSAFEWVHRRRNGEDFAAEVLLSAFELGGRRVLQARVRDITERKQADEALREANQFSQEIISSAQEGVMVYDRDLRLRVWNPFMEQLTGVAARDILGHHPLDFFPFLREAGVIDSLESALAGGTPPAIVFPYNLPETGRSGWTSCMSSPLRNAKGEIIGVIATVREITEQKKAQDALEGVTGLMRNIIDTSPDFIFVKDANLRSILCNEAYANAIGKRPEDLFGKTDIENGWDPDLVHGDPSRGIRGFETDDRDALEGLTVHNPSDPANVGGEIKVFDTVKLPLRAADGSLIGVLGVARDITERKQVEDALREGEQRFDEIARQATEMIWEVDANGLYTYMSQVSEALTGYSPEEVVGKKHFYDIHPRQGRAEFKEAALAAFARQDSIRGMENPIERKDGRIVWVSTNGMPILDSHGNLAGYRGSDTDITERKQIDAERERVSAEIRDLYNNAPCGYQSVDENGDFIRMNDTELSWLGYTRDEVIGKLNMVDILTPKCQADFLENFPRLKEEGSVRDMEAEIVRKDGTIIPVLLSATALMDAQGKYVMSRTTLFDISERKRAEEETRQVRVFLNAVVDTLPVAVFVKDAAEHRFTLWNRAAEVIFGMPAGDALGKNDYDFFPKEQADFFWAKDVETLSGDSVLDIPEEPVDTSRRGRRYLHTQKVRVNDPDGNAQYLLAVSEDITDRKRMEDALAAEYQATEAMSDLRSALLSSKSLDDIASRVLTHGKDLTGSRYGYVGYVAPDTDSLVYAALSADECRTPAAKSISSSPAGLRGWVLQNKKPVLSNSPEQDQRWGGTPKGHVPITRFISAPALLGDELVGQVALANSERDYDENDLSVVERLAAFFALAIQHSRSEEALAKHSADLARSNSDLQQFAYIASHDLQEPLRMVSSYIQLLAKRYEGKLDQDAGEFIGYAVDGTHRMQALINGLLDFSRVGTQGKSFEHIDCESVMKAATDNLKVAVQESGAVVTHDPLPTVIADAGQLTQLLQNLIGNAIKYHGDAPPTVHVSAEEVEQEWVFSISDNGIGIAPEHFDRIFQIFQRLHVRNEYPGTGIGLAVCKRIVERHSGRIWVESEVGKGSTFRFAIPTNLPTSETAETLAMAA